MLRPPGDLPPSSQAEPARAQCLGKAQHAAAETLAAHFDDVKSALHALEKVDELLHAKGAAAAAASSPPPSRPRPPEVKRPSLRFAEAVEELPPTIAITSPGSERGQSPPPSLGALMAEESTDTQAATTRLSASAQSSLLSSRVMSPQALELKQHFSMHTLEEGFAGATKSTKEELQTIYDRTLMWDLAMVFPNPDWRPEVEHGCDPVEHWDGICSCDARCQHTVAHWLLSLLQAVFTWEPPNLSLILSGVTESQAMKFYQQSLRGGTMGSSAHEDIFKNAFSTLQEYIPPYASHRTPLDGCRSFDRRDSLVSDGQDSEDNAAHPRDPKRIPRRVSHGDTFKRKKEEGFDESGTHGYFVTYDYSENGTEGCKDMLSLVRTTIISKLVGLGFVVEQVFSSDYKYIYALVGGPEETFQHLAHALQWPLLVDLQQANEASFEPHDAFCRPFSHSCRHHQEEEPSSAPRKAASRLPSRAAPSRSSEVSPMPRQGGLSPAAASDQQLEAYARYQRLRAANPQQSAAEILARVNGGATVVAEHTRGEASGGEGRLKSFWEVLGMDAPPCGVRAAYRLDESHPLQWHTYPAQTISGLRSKSILSRTDRIRLIMRSIEREVSVARLEHRGFLVDTVPLPHAPTAVQTSGMVTTIRDTLSHFVDLANKEIHQLLVLQKTGDAAPFHNVMELYFTFVKHLAKRLAPAAAFGLIVLAVASFLPSSILVLCFLQSVFLIAWGTMWLTSWTHIEDQLLLRWGILSRDRKHFSKGPLRFDHRFVQRRCPISGKDEPHLGATRRYTACSIFCTSLLVVGQLVLVWFILSLRPRIHKHLYVAAIKYNVSQNVVALVNAIVILTINAAIRSISMALTKREKHRNQKSFVYSYTIKAVVLQLINSYASLIYVAFFMDAANELVAGGTNALCEYDTSGGSNAVMDFFWWTFPSGDCSLTLLNRNFAVLLLVFIGKNAVEIGAPEVQIRLAKYLQKHSAMHRRRQAVMPVGPVAPHSGSASSSGSGSQMMMRLGSPHARSAGVGLGGRDFVAELDTLMLEPRFGKPDYSHVGPVEDYSELAVMLGFLLFFSVTFPIAGLVSFVSCFVEARVDALKFRRLARQPVPSSISGIGVWDDILNGLIWTAVGVNAAFLVWPLGIGKTGIVHKLFGGHSLGAELIQWIVLCGIFAAVRLSLLKAMHARPWHLEVIDSCMRQAAGPSWSRYVDSSIGLSERLDLHSLSCKANGFCDYYVRQPFEGQFPAAA
eukprot:TRINITY_DN45058_c0_g1_i1.p1 TRINITY_DN45058_c0_g1~~TRINITY_DN45058_c0_g1_i1.p1  ORF type:complete len:1244 (+),score=245.18 TRINITY_DN45058_c0_g1_i1:189-3920(+)